MLNFFKSKEQLTAGLKETFLLGKNAFTIDKSESVIVIKDNEIIDLTIKTSQEEFEKFSASESFEFSWALYAPMFYARGLMFGKKKQVNINNKNMFDHEVALYFMEHGDVKVTISLKDDSILITGFAVVFGIEYPLEIFIKY